MIAELLAGTGQSIVRRFPPDGRRYWAKRFWDRDTHEGHPRLRAAFLRQKDTIAGFIRDYAANADRILEFACGTGEFTRLAVELTAAREITAVDISAEALRFTRERVRHDNLQLVHADFWSEVDVAPAGVVTCLDAIHHLGDVRAVMTRLRSFVAPGGVLVGNLWIADNYHRFQRLRYGSVAHLLRTASFLGTAVLIRVSGGRLRTGAYRTQLVHSERALQILREVFDTVHEVSVEEYFMGFVVGVAAAPERAR
jgi:SAM-dependent methyltransferase